MYVQNDGYEHTIGTFMDWIDIYTPSMQETLRKQDKERRRSAGVGHQDKKTTSKYRYNDPLVINIENVYYQAGVNFEDHTPDDVNHFEMMEDMNDQLLREIDGLDNQAANM